MNDFSLFQMIAKAVQRDCDFNVLVRLGDDEPRYVSKIQQGIVFYDPRNRLLISKSLQNKNKNQYIGIHRQITSLRVQTHTRK
jgi:hypothetical protein